MPPGVSGRRTAPDAMDGDHHWYPTMEEFKDFKTYMEYLESQGAHEKGVALVHVSSYYIYALAERAKKGVRSVLGLRAFI